MAPCTASGKPPLMGMLVLGAVAALAGGGQVVDLDKLASEAAQAAVTKYADRKVQAEQLGVAVAVLDRAAGKWRQGGFRSDQPMYPASVVKLFYITYLSHLLETKRLKKTEEIERAAHDMIVDSDNDATNWLVEVVTGAASGPELGPRELRSWMDKRQAVNRYFREKGYADVNACQKTWYSGPYGRERQGYGKDWALRNSLTPNACLRLMSEIMLDRAASPDKCAWMKGFLSRQTVADGKEPDEQSRGYSGKVLPKGWQLWSKAGWTDSVRHDVAAVRTPDGREYVWVIFTKGQIGVSDLVPFIAGELIRGLGG